MTGESRLNRLYPGLTARERALHALQALKADVPEDPQVRLTMPDNQVDPFNHYIDLIRAANRVNAGIIWLDGRVESLNARLGWLSTLHLWSLRSLDLDFHLWARWKEPIAESDHAALVARKRAEYVQVSELAELLADRIVGPPDTNATWANVLADKRRELNDLVQRGALPSRGKGSRLSINLGAFYDHLGEPTPVHPDWGSEFQVLPDAQTDQIRTLRDDGTRLRALLSGAPSLAFPSVNAADDELDGTPTRIATILTRQLRDGISDCWRQLQSIETILCEIAAEFDDEDPLAHAQRETLNSVRDALIDLHARAAQTTGDFELAGADEDLTAQLREALDVAPITGTKIAYLSLSDVR